MSAVVVSHLGKAYRQYSGRWARLAEWVLPGSKPRHRLNWVLQDVSFDVEPGEAIGIVGINGAGKSTLLKLIVGTTQPTTGSVEVQGNVAALLELGMGFHPDFTGRQNVWMAGQLLGFSIEEIGRLMPEIEAFAEIGAYIDQPVRVYSSGMQMRLAFAVASARRPDVLIVDEALSVGDAYFQHKSFQRIREFRALGTTLLIVSHDRQAIQTICDRAILLNAGAVEMIGEPEVVLDHYTAMLAVRQKGNRIVHRRDHRSAKTATVSGTGEARVVRFAMYDSAGDESDSFEVGETVTLEAHVEVTAPIPRLVLGFMIKDRLGNPVYGTNTYYTQNVLHDVKPGDKFSYRFKFALNIGVGNFAISTALVSSDTHHENNYDTNEIALVIETVNSHHVLFIGTAWLDAEVSVASI